MRADPGAPHELGPLAHERLTRPVVRMRLAREDQLHGPLRTREDAGEPLAIVEQERGSLVGGEAAREAERQRVGMEDRLHAPLPQPRRSVRGFLPAQPVPGVVHQRRPAGRTHAPDPLVVGGAHALFQAGLVSSPRPSAAEVGPQPVGFAAIPARDVDAVGDVADRHLARRQPREEGLEQAAAHLGVQPAHAIDPAAAADREIGHVEGLRGVAGIPPAQREQIVHGDAQRLPRVLRQVLPHELGGEAVEAGLHRRVRREHVPGAGDGERLVERASRLLHVLASPLQHGERGVPLVQVADVRGDAEQAQQAPAEHPEQQLLLETQLGPAAVQLAGDGPDVRRVGGVVGVEQVQPASSHLHFPGPDPHRAAGERGGHPEPLAVLGSDGKNRKLAGLVDRIERLLVAVGVELLAEVSLLVEQPHGHHGNAEVARRLQLVAGDVAEAAGVDRQRLAQHVLHAEVRHGPERRGSVYGLEPGRRRVRFLGLRQQLFHPCAQRGVETSQLLGRGGLQDQPRVPRELPQLGVELLPDLVGRVVPRPAEVERQTGEGIGVLHFGGRRSKRRANGARQQDSTRATAATSWAAEVGRVQGMAIATSRIRNGIAFEVEMRYLVSVSELRNYLGPSHGHSLVGRGEVPDAPGRVPGRELAARPVERAAGGGGRARGARAGRWDHGLHLRRRQGPESRDLPPRRSAALGREPAGVPPTVLGSSRRRGRHVPGQAARRHRAGSADAGARQRQERRKAGRDRGAARRSRVRGGAAADDG